MEVKVEQGSPEWIEARLGRATASRAQDILATIKSGEAAQRKNYRTELVLERLTGQVAESYQSKEMQNGIETEPLARLQYELRTGNKVKECGFFHHETLMAGASPDGLVDEGLLEIKCRNSANHIATLRKGLMPENYLPQIQMQLWITGRKWCDFVSFDPRLPEHAQLFIQRILRDDTYISSLTKQVERFLGEVDEEVKFVEGYKQ